MTDGQVMITVAAVSLGVMVPRLLPFLLFGRRGGAFKGGGYMTYLESVLPAASISLIVVYCFKDTPFLTGSHGVAELLAAAVVAALHLWKRNILLSIGAGTAVYMALINAAGWN